jgi:hypothetical protein
MSTQKTEHKSVPQKSPNYPSMSLDEAIAKAKTLYEKDGKVGAPKKVALEHLGYKVESGASARTISALKKFDLISDLNGRIVPTQRAIDLLVYPADSDRFKASLKHCALNPKIYRTLWAEYSNGFPSDAALKAELIDRHNFNPNQVDGFLNDFRKTIQFAGLTQDSEGEEQIEEEMPEQPRMDQPGQPVNPRTTPGAFQRLANSYPIPLKNQNQATLVFNKLPVEKDDLNKIKLWIELFEESLTTTDSAQ